MEFKDSFFKKVKKKTKVDKDTILSLAKKLQNSDMKDEKVLRDMVHEISSITGKEVSKEREDKIVNAIVNDNVPKDIDKKIQELPIINFSDSEVFQQVLFSEDFTDIFNYYKTNYLPDVLKAKPEIEQKISLYCYGFTRFS